MPINTPMHRIKYTNLTKDQIGQRLKAVESVGPTSISALSDALSGKTFRIVTDGGPTLDYEFTSKNLLMLSENGGAKTAAGYGALTMEQGVIFSHLIPGAQKGYNVFLDLETDLVTVIEVWFSSGMKIGTQAKNDIIVEDREVQREVYFGYIETAGKNPPEARHHRTNRMEGKGLYWKQDTGVETLEFYVSVASVNFVELTRYMDYLSYCSPSDYVLINDNMFIHNRSEAEFSGIFTMFAIDLFSVTQAGVRLGFNEKDELEYYMFRGEGEIVGQIARLEPFSEHGLVAMGAQSKDPQDTVKGQRQAYRPARTFQYMTDEEMHEAALKRTLAFGEGVPTSMAANRMPFTEKLTGKEFTLRYDRTGPVRHYRFQEGYKLSYRDDGETQWREAEYRAYEADRNLFFFTHILADSKPRASEQVIVDFANGLTTCIHSRMGTEYYGNETTYYPLFGVMEMKGINPPRYTRHGFTDELIGQCFSMSWSDQLTSMHLYTSADSMCWTIFTDDQIRGSQWSSPAMFIKFRPQVYLIVQNEEACNGVQMTLLLNRKTMRSSGCEFSGGARGVMLYPTGAYVRHIGKFDVKGFYVQKI